jgi:hypothetical protein
MKLAQSFLLLFLNSFSLAVLLESFNKGIVPLLLASLGMVGFSVLLWNFLIASISKVSEEAKRQMRG